LLVRFFDWADYAMPNLIGLVVVSVVKPLEELRSGVLAEEMLLLAVDVAGFALQTEVTGWEADRCDKRGRCHGGCCGAVQDGIGISARFRPNDGILARAAIC
jgi:hypothetical protein